MKIILNLEFDNMDELKESVERLYTARYTTAREIQKAIEETDFTSLADTKVVEEAPAIPEPQDSNLPSDPTPEPAGKPGFNMTRAEVKAYCAVARTEKGVNIKEILNGLGAAKFTELPDERLGELYDRVKAARGD